MTACFPVFMAALLLVAGCQSTPPTSVEPERQLLAVFANDLGAEPVTGASTRGYRGRTDWPVSLHTLVRARRVARDHELREIQAWPIRALGIYCVVLEVPPGTARQLLIRRLNGDPRVMQAQSVNQYQGMLGEAYDDPLFDVQFGEHGRTLESIHAITRGSGVRVAIIDGQVDVDHPDLRGQVRPRYADSMPEDRDMLRHGTAVSGVVAAAAGNSEGLVGIAPDAEVSVYAACRHVDGGTTRCTSVSLAQAIEQAVEDRSDVMNLSLAGPSDWLLERLLEHAHERDVLLIAAESHDEGHGFPASLPFVHAAGEESSPWFAQPARFSTLAGGGYQMFFGASMSAAGASAVATLLRSQRSARDTSEQLELLLGPDCSRAATRGSIHDPVLKALAEDVYCNP